MSSLASPMSAWVPQSAAATAAAHAEYLMSGISGSHGGIGSGGSSSGPRGAGGSTPSSSGSGSSPGAGRAFAAQSHYEPQSRVAATFDRPTEYHDAVDAAANSSLRQLSAELETVKRAWRSDGSDLRARLMAVHKAKLEADEVALTSESQMKELKDRFKAEAARQQMEVRKQEIMLSQMREKLSRDTATLQRQLEVKDQEVEAVRAKHRAMETKLVAMSGEVTNLTGQVSQSRAAATRSQEHASLLEKQLTAAQHELAQERSKYRSEIARYEAEMLALRQTAEGERHSKALDGATARSQIVRLEQQVAELVGQLREVQEEATVRETTLSVDMGRVIARAEAAEKERDAAWNEITQLRGTVIQLQQQLGDVLHSIVQLSSD